MAHATSPTGPYIAPRWRPALLLWAALCAACGADADGPLGERSSPLLGGGAPIQLRNAVSGLCLDISGAGQADGDRAIVWGCASARNQAFALALPEGAAPSYELVAQHSGKCLDIYGGFTGTRVPAIQYACAGSANQRFALRATDGGYQLVAQHSQLCLTPDSSSAGAGVSQRPCALTAGSQAWTAVPNGCLAAQNGCDRNATCAPDAAGAATCTCKAGYSGDGFTCDPINPCTTNNGGCDKSATCTMTGPGARSCKCNAGTCGNGAEGTCKQVTEVGLLIENAGKYLAGWEVWFDDQRVVPETLPSGARGEIRIPLGAKNVRLRAWAIGGVEVMDLRWAEATRTRSYRVSGTTLYTGYSEDGVPLSYCL